MTTRPNRKDSGPHYCDDLEYSPYLLERENLENMSTRLLLQYLRSKDGRENETFRDLLKEILATREHIPTKAQARELRRQKAKAKKHR